MTDDLRQWLDQSHTPVVYISTGTNVRLRTEQLLALVCPNALQCGAWHALILTVRPHR
jgi:hypothetical protein